MSAPLSRYRVSLITWDLLQVVVEASDENAALTRAQALHAEHGEAAFRHRDGGTDGWVCDAE